MNLYASLIFQDGAVFLHLVFLILLCLFCAELFSVIIKCKCLQSAKCMKIWAYAITLRLLFCCMSWSEASSGGNCSIIVFHFGSAVPICYFSCYLIVGLEWEFEGYLCFLLYLNQIIE